jgi:hypothetical protein
MKGLENKSMSNFSRNYVYAEEKKNSVPIGFAGKVRYQCASSIITIPVSIVRGLNLKLGDTVIVSVVKEDSKDNLQIK